MKNFTLIEKLGACVGIIFFTFGVIVIVVLAVNGYYDCN